MTFTLKAVRPSLHFMTAQARPSLKCGAIRKQFELHGRRCQGTIAPDAHSQNWLHKMWNSPIGIKTVHFWWVRSCWMGFLFSEKWLTLRHGAQV